MHFCFAEYALNTENYNSKNALNLNIIYIQKIHHDKTTKNKGLCFTF